MRIVLFILKRAVFLIPILLGISIVTFAMTHVLPGDPLYILLGPYAKQEDIDRERVRLGLDRPLPVQYVVYLQGLAHGDLGMSYRSRQSVVQDLSQRFPATFELTTLSLLLACLIGIPLGVQAAVHRDLWPDHIIRVLSVGGVSIPIFWVGVVLIYVLYFKLHLAPPPLGRLGAFMQPPRTVTGMYTVDALLAGNWPLFQSALSHIALPAITLGFAMLAPIMRITRNSMLEALNSSYVRTATALGLSKNTVVYKDALRNALLPVVTSIGLIYGWSLGGEVLVEVVFSWPGMGYYAVNSILNMDFAPVQGFVLLTALIYVTVNLAVDILYTLIDPRITV